MHKNITYFLYQYVLSSRNNFKLKINNKKKLLFSYFSYCHTLHIVIIFIFSQIVLVLSLKMYVVGKCFVLLMMAVLNNRWTKRCDG